MHVNQQWINYTLQCCFHVERVMAYVADRIEPQYLTHPSVKGTQAQKVLYGVLRSYYLRHKRRPPMEVVVIELRDLMANQGFGVDQQMKDELAVLLSNLSKPLTDTTALEPVFDFINRVFRVAEGDARLKRAVEDGLQQGNYVQIAQEAQQIQSRMTTLRESHNPLKKEDTLPKQVVRSGVTWFDQLVNELRAGCCYGVIVPSGGGKTTLASQLSISSGLQGRKVAVVYTEQSMQEAEMVDRFWAILTGRPIADFSPYNSEREFPPDLVSEADRMNARRVMDNVQIFDFSLRPGSLDELEAIANGQMGVKPDILLVDWAGQFARQLMMLNKSFADNETLALSIIADRCCEIARRANIPVILFHQMAPHEVGSPVKHYDHMMAHQCKSFCHNMSYGIVICPADKDNVTRVCVTKGRYFGKGEQIVRLRGEYGRFEALDNYRRGTYKYEPTDRSPDKMPSVEEREDRIQI